MGWARQHARMQTPAVTLRYFAVLGRAQPLRAALVDAGVAFTDHHVTPEEWIERREDPAFGGPFQGLPTLTWGESTIGETLAIASFLSRQFGEYDGCSNSEVARREAITSNCYSEVLLRVGELIWASLVYPGADPRHALGLYAPRMLQKLDAVEAQLAGAWLCGARPGLADFFACESLAAIGKLCDAERDARLRLRLPRLFAHSSALALRPQLAASPPRRPTNFTSHPDEPAVLTLLAGAEWPAL